jgi:hypothetical protein
MKCLDVFRIDKTHAEEALIQVISAAVMERLLPIGAVITVQMPYRNDDVPMDIVAVRTNRHSCTVDLKHRGRASGSTISSGRSTGGDSGLLTAVEGSLIVISGTAVSGVKSTMAEGQLQREMATERREERQEL